MPRTAPRVSFGLFALEIRQDSTPSADDLQPFAKLTDLRDGSGTNRPYASYEPDFWLLDGQYKFLPDDYTPVHVGMMSLEMSDVNGDFTVPPVLTITFSQVHSVDGLALRFSPYTGDYADSITVAYYDAADALIRSDLYAPNGTEWSTGQVVSDFKKIIITFHSTNRPYRYLRLTAIDYGDLIFFEGSEIKSAHVVEEADPLSAEVRFNTLDLTIHTDDAQFSIINPQGYYAALKERQPLAVYEQVDNADIFVGQYYLDEWENESDTEVLFHAVDLLGVLDRMTFRGGIWTGSGINLEDLIEDILGAISVPYELDVTLYGTVVLGWLPISSYREALQQIAFAVGATVECSRSGTIKIYATKIAADSIATATITKSQKGASQKLALRSMVTGVEVTAHNYLAGSESKELYNSTLAAGDYEIAFAEPMHSLSITGATITESGANYAIINVAAPGAVVLDGQKYVDTIAVTRVTDPGVSPGVRPNVLKITDATLVNSTNVSDVANRVFDYYQQRYRQKLRLYAPTVTVGTVALVDTLYNKQLRGVIERMDINLALGMTADVEMVGVENA